MSTDEHEYLAKTLVWLATEKENIDRRFADGVEAGDENAAESIRKMLETRFRQLRLVQHTPYFARIDFTETDCHGTRMYLGKTTLYDDNNDIVVADWRAPMATLYYENRLGAAAYDCLDGHIEGELTLKRQLTIQNGTLLHYEDIDITSDDELLRPYLSVSADSRLKNIIATIQGEQNRIIRADLNRPLIVQGVAGSGKTTVALHRIAYLVYTYAQSFQPDRFMILAPGGFFLRYIANVLPDLGVEDVVQVSFDELVSRHVKTKWKLADQNERLFDCVHAETARYKSSHQIFKDIDAFLVTNIARFFPKKDFVAGVLTVATRDALFNRFCRENTHLPLFERLARIGDMITLMSAGIENSKKSVSAYLKTVQKPSTMALYREFLQQPIDSKQALEYEDLTPLLYLHHRVYGARDRFMRHIVIDEAQDFSPAQLWLLTELFPSASFTSLGDLAQGIYQNRNVTDWETVNQQVWKGEAQIALLQKSYRTTIEIMAEANTVLAQLPGIPPGEAVIRHGEPVRYLDATENRAAQCEAVLATLTGHQNIAIICKDIPACKLLAKALTLPKVQLLLGGLVDYTGGVCILPAALSKGLEFDAVIIADADSYGDDKTSLHLLYVAMTRAMHDLTIIR